MEENKQLAKSPQKSQVTPHLKDYLRVLVVRRWVLLSVFMVIVSLVALKVFIQTPIYRATAVLLIEPSKTNVTDFKAVYDPLMGNSEMSKETFMKTQFQLILAEPILEKVFTRFQFGAKKEFRDIQNPLEKFKKLFFVIPLRKTRLVEVSFEWPQPEDAARVVDFLVNEYVESCRKRRLGVSEEGLASLKVQTEELKPKVEEKAEKLQAFMNKNNMVSFDKSQDIVVDSLKQINTNLVAVEAHRIQAETVYKNIAQAVSSNNPLDQLPEIISSQTVRDLKLEFIKAKQENNSLSNRFGPNHPEVMATNAKLNSIVEKLTSEVQSILASAKAEYTRASSHENELRQALAEQEKVVLEFNKKAIEYNLLRESYEAMSKAYRVVTDRIEEIKVEMATGSKEDNIFIISQAKPPIIPVKPRKLMSLMVASILGFILGAALCFFIEYLDTTIKTKDEVENLLETPVIGFVPAVQEDSNGTNGTRPIELFSIDKPNSHLAEAFRSIRTALTFSDAGKGARSLILTSSVPMEGKTLISVNLAIALAKTGKKVLLVDADMRRPRLSKVLSPKARHGLSELLIKAEGVTLDSCIQTTDLESFHILPSGTIPPNPAELLGGDTIGDLIDEIQDKYDHVIFDTPPIVSAADATVLSQFVDGVMMVVRAFTTQRDVALRARDTLINSSGKLIGVILNSVDAPQNGSYGGAYYYDKYYYGDGRHMTNAMRKRSKKDADLIRRRQQELDDASISKEDSAEDSIDDVIEHAMAAISKKGSVKDKGRS